MTEQTMTPDEVLKVLALVNAASPGPWEPEDMESDGVYGDGGPDGRAGFMAQRMRDANGVSIFDSLNSEGAMVDEDIGEEFVYAWDVVAEKNFKAISAAMEFIRKHGTAVAALIEGEAVMAAKINDREVALAGAFRREDALIARNAELEADAQRLEFLISKEVIPHKMSDTSLYMLIGADHYPYDGSEHETPREAIDAARAEAGHG